MGIPLEHPLAKPFLRWAGGKNWLIKHLLNIKNLRYRNYHELFLGGASTFFYLEPEKHAYLSDLNESLIETYNAVKTDASSIIRVLKTFKNSEEAYYQVRERQYEKKFERAAKFIFLNQTSYNGIYRVNLKGIYNVPYGFRTKEFLDETNLLLVQKALQNTTIEQSDFGENLTRIKSKDLVFLDPPYTVSHNNNGFIKYNDKLFSLDDQIRLSKLLDEIKRKGAYYILTNAAHKKVAEIFEKGDRKLTLERASLIGGTNAKRAAVKEFIFTNVTI